MSDDEDDYKVKKVITHRVFDTGVWHFQVMFDDDSIGWMGGSLAEFGSPFREYLDANVPAVSVNEPVAERVQSTESSAPAAEPVASRSTPSTETIKEIVMGIERAHKSGFEYHSTLYRGRDEAFILYEYFQRTWTNHVVLRQAACNNFYLIFSLFPYGKHDSLFLTDMMAAHLDTKN